MKNFKSISRGFFIHASLIIVSLLSIFPFLWLMSTAMKGPDENIFQYPPVFFPQHPTWVNFKGVWNQIPMKTRTSSFGGTTSIGMSSAI